ncbi:hypothetical protein M5689_008548 [Euphorbia peplus]|nr:hypothetical protein M5689_008548 [Euphorbia peplus]
MTQRKYGEKKRFADNEKLSLSCNRKWQKEKSPHTQLPLFSFFPVVLDSTNIDNHLGFRKSLPFSTHGDSIILSPPSTVFSVEHEVK